MNIAEFFKLLGIAGVPTKAKINQPNGVAGLDSQGRQSATEFDTLTIYHMGGTQPFVEYDGAGGTLRIYDVTGVLLREVATSIGSELQFDPTDPNRLTEFIGAYMGTRDNTTGLESSVDPNNGFVQQDLNNTALNVKVTVKGVEHPYYTSSGTLPALEADLVAQVAGGATPRPVVMTDVGLQQFDPVAGHFSLIGGSGGTVTGTTGNLTVIGPTGGLADGGVALGALARRASPAVADRVATLTASGDVKDGGFTAGGSFNPNSAIQLPASSEIDASTTAKIRALVGGAQIGGVDTVATTNINLAAPGASIGGVALSVGQVFLATSQTARAENGPWVWQGAAVAATRPTWANTWTQIAGNYVFVTGGTNNGTIWRMTGSSTGTVGTDPQVWSIDSLTTAPDPSISFVSTAGTAGGNGTLTRPFRQAIQAFGRSGANFPHVVILAGQTFDGTTHTSGQPNTTIMSLDGYRDGGKSQVTTQTVFDGTLLTVTGASATAGTATLTFATQATAPFAVGQSVVVSGMTPTGYNGTVTVTACTTSSVSYASAGTGAMTVAGTVAGGSTRNRYRGVTFNTGATVPFDFRSGSQMRHAIEDCAIVTTATGLMQFGTVSNWLDLINLDTTGSPLATIPLANGLTYNIDKQRTRLPFSGTGNASTVVNIEATCDSGTVRIPFGFLGVVFRQNTFTGQLTGVITDQASLTALLANTMGTDLVPRYYLVTGFVPTQGSALAGAIIGKQSGAGQTENWLERSNFDAPSSVATAAGHVFNKSPGNVWRLSDLVLTNTLNAAAVSGTTAAGTYIQLFGTPTTNTALNAPFVWSGTAATPLATYAQTPALVERADGATFRKNGSGGWSGATASQFMATRTTNQTLGSTAPQTLVFNNVVISTGPAISYNPTLDILTLRAGWTFELQGYVQHEGPASAFIVTQWWNVTNNVVIPNIQGVAESLNAGTANSAGGPCVAIFRPTTDVQVRLQTFASGAGSIMRALFSGITVKTL